MCSRPFNGRLFFICTFLSWMWSIAPSYGHASPNSLLIVSVAPKEIHLEVQLPVPELELAFKQPLSKDPESIITNYGSELKTYLLAHIKAYGATKKDWNVVVENLSLTKGFYADGTTPYWEVVAYVTIQPIEGENIRDFYLAYDAIMHQVVNHIALVAIKSDWENGNLGASYNQTTAMNEATLIAWDLKTNTIPPLHINLEEGNYWKGLMAMIRLGMHHIYEGIDHLMFIVVLLLPAPLLVEKKRWSRFKGMKSSIKSLVRIITAFTIGHSITLLLGALGWYHIPQAPVEILIAGSIAVAAIHAIRPFFAHKEILIAGGFGLIHGMAFAATISEMDLDTWTMVLSIFGFNAGIEIMQLVIVACIIPWLIIMSKTPYYKWFRVPVALATMIASIAWIVERWNAQKNWITLQLDKIATHYVFILIGIALVATGMFLVSRKYRFYKNVS